GYTSQVNTSVDSIQNTLSGAIATLNEAKVSNDLKAMTDAAAKVNQDLTEINEKLGVMATSLAPTDSNTQAALKVLQENVKTVNKAMDLVITAGNNAVDNNLASKREDAISAINTAITNLENMQKQITNNLMPQINQSLDGLTQILENSQNLMNNMASVLGGMNNIFGSLQVTANSATTSLEKTSEALGMLSDRLTDAIEKVEAAADGDKAKILMETLSGDPEMYGEFFAEPVHIETEVLYPVDNYGSAVTPFYTTLAIWVGALILTAILKVHPDHTKYEGAKGWQLFFGRYALFFLMGQLQTLITVLGDLKFLHVQCLHPVYFWLASAVTSMIFSLLIYSLVSAFGDVGKAAAVVIVVLQIAGSSGTYPIELLPEFFQKVYIFFPFPYAINAMRESVAGFYEHDFLIYLLQLCLFIPVSLAIGIWIRRPFKKMNHFMEERMEETEMM
ncbi:MAG: YhgE/Pip domain-containing protein, partial [Lachnospiraceae bacterium]|nr:YhgE/Pip domain-containing protein [Lachnospiraceae bacterium]